MNECNAMDLDFERYNSAVLAFREAFSSSSEQSENERNNLNHFTDPVSISGSQIINLQFKIKLEIIKKKLNSVAFSPQANYTDRATAACRRS
jgi:hypothetical protein